MTEKSNKTDPDLTGAVTDPVTGDEAAIAEPIPALNTDMVIDAFGGIRPMAAKLGVAVSTVQGWKTRDHIPENRWREIQAAAATHGVDLESLPTEDTATADAPDEPDQENADSADTPTEEQAATADNHAEQDDSKPDADPEPSDTQPAPPVQKNKSTDSRPGGAALLFGLVALVAVLTRPVWSHYVDPHVARIAGNFGLMVQTEPAAPASTGQSGDAASADMVATLQGQIAALQDRLSEVEDRPSVVSADGTPIGITDELAQRLAAIEEQLKSISETTVTAQNFQAEADAALAQIRSVSEAMANQDSATLNNVTERLAALEASLSEVSGTSYRALSDIAAIREQMVAQSSSISSLENRPSVEGAAQAGLALAVGDIEMAMAAGRPFENALSRLDSLSHTSGGPAISQAAANLQPYAAEGVETIAGLTARFTNLAPAMQTEFATNSGDLVATLFDGAKSLISIRRKGEAPDAPPVSRAEAALERGDLDSAVAALAPERERSPSADEWLVAAERRLAADALLNALRAAVADGLTGTLGTSNSGDPS